MKEFVTLLQITAYEVKSVSSYVRRAEPIVDAKENEASAQRLRELVQQYTEHKRENMEDLRAFLAWALLIVSAEEKQ